MKRLLIVLLIAIFAFSIACDKSEDDAKDMNKIIPPIATMEVDLSKLTSANSRTSTITFNEGVCIVKGGVLVTWGTSICFGYLATPIAIFKVLKDQTPTTAKKDYVQWKYSKDGYTVAVTAEKKGGVYDWEWSLTLNDAEVLTGASMENASSGWWQFHNLLYPAGSNNTIKVEWSYVDETNMTLKFLNNEDNNDYTIGENGDYIEYALAGQDLSVTFYDLHSGTTNTGSETKTKVYINTATLIGGIEVIIGTEISCTWDPTIK